MNQGYKMLGSDTCTFQVHDVDFVQLLNCHHSNGSVWRRRTAIQKVYHSVHTGDILLSTKKW